MTQVFTPIYSDTHLFSDGNITIEHEVTQQSIIYCQVTNDALTTNLNLPILRGFLYQFLSDGKRSRPYPIISEKQSIKLDLESCNGFIFVPSNRLIDYYDLDLFIAVDSIGNNQNSSQNISWVDITDKPLTFAPSSHTHLISEITGLNDVLDDHEDRLNALELATPVTSSGDSIYNLVSTNQSLEGNKKYLVTVTGLTLNLPSTPNTGDAITVSTGNFDTKVLQTNSSHQILNSSTLTMTGVGNGLILKPNADVSIIYLGGNLWKTTAKNRIINNWQVPIEDDANPVLQSYTATNFGDGTPTSGFGFDKLYDGNLSRGFDASGAFISCIVSFASPKRLVKFDYSNGFDGSFLCSRLKIYQGSTKSGTLLKDLSFSGLPVSGTNIFLDTVVSSQTYVFEFFNGTGLNFAELKLYAPDLIGGEITVS